MTVVDTDVPGGSQVGLAEFRVREGSPFAGQRLGDLALRRQYGVTVIGQWSAGVFSTTKGPDTRIDAGTILVVVGTPDNLERIKRVAMPIRRSGPIVLAGYGSVGRKVTQMLNDAGEACVVIDRVAAPGVTVVSNSACATPASSAVARQKPATASVGTAAMRFDVTE